MDSGIHSGRNVMSVQPVPRPKLGAVFPHFTFGPDPEEIRHFATTLEEIGFDHLLAYDHVLGGSAEGRPELTGRYTSEHNFHEVMVLFGYLAGVTTRLGLVSGVIILPQRQTALVAKQAAEIDILSRGRMRLGVGIGWNAIEYEGLGENFHNRGKRLEEQIALLRELWTQRVISFNGKWHTVDRAGTQPLPVQQPIPIWIGGSSEIAVRRAARLGDGFFPNQKSLEEDAANLRILREEAERIGRDPASIGIEPRINLNDNDPEEWQRRYEFWCEQGASHITLATIVQPSSPPDDHLQRLERAYRLLRG
jgi:probable F420-dependent oxidoreductase